MLIDAVHDYLAHQPQFSSANLIQLLLQQRPAGYLAADTVAILSELAPHWHPRQGRIDLSGALLAKQLQTAAAFLRQQRHILHWRNEEYGVYIANQHGEFNFARALCTLERAAFRRFGLLSRAIHVNGYYQNGDICLARRAKTKGIDPDRLDNIAAGGIPYGEDVFACAKRELAEEAGVPLHLAQQLQWVGEHRVQRNEIDGTHDELLYCFDLCLPDDFTPQNTDGEVAAFYRVSPRQAAAHLAEMTWDAGRVTADFLIRHLNKA